MHSDMCCCFAIDILWVNVEEYSKVCAKLILSILRGGAACFFTGRGEHPWLVWSRNYIEEISKDVTDAGQPTTMEDKATQQMDAGWLSFALSPIQTFLHLYILHLVCFD